MKPLGKKVAMIKGLVGKTRSYRRFDEADRIPRDVLVDLVDTARMVASAGNRQPLKYAIVSDPDACERLFGCCTWAAQLKDWAGPQVGERPTGFIVICKDTDIHPNLYRFQRDVGIVAQTMLLTAVEMGLGGCMIGDFSGDALHAALGLDESIRPLLIVAVGKPDETVILTDVADGKTASYRDEQDRHYVPKRALADIVLGDAE